MCISEARIRDLCGISASYAELQFSFYLHNFGSTRCLSVETLSRKIPFLTIDSNLVFFWLSYIINFCLKSLFVYNLSTEYTNLDFWHKRTMFHCFRFWSRWVNIIWDACSSSRHSSLCTKRNENPSSDRSWPLVTSLLTQPLCGWPKMLMLGWLT